MARLPMIRRARLHGRCAGRLGDADPFAAPVRSCGFQDRPMDGSAQGGFVAVMEVGVGADLIEVLLIVHRSGADLPGWRRAQQCSDRRGNLRDRRRWLQRAGEPDRGWRSGDRNWQRIPPGGRTSRLGDILDATLSPAVGPAQALSPIGTTHSGNVPFVAARFSREPQTRYQSAYPHGWMARRMRAAAQACNGQVVCMCPFPEE